MRNMRLPEDEKMPLHHGKVVEKPQSQQYGAVDTTSTPTTTKSSILPRRRWTGRSSIIIISIAAMTVLYHLLTAFLLFASSSLAVPAAISSSGSPPVNDSSDAFWAGLRPNRKLQWHKCYDGRLDCARLDVPLDWQNPSDKERVVLAVVRQSAKNRTDYRGPLFYNPGGPGGSGVFSLAGDRGDYLQRRAGYNHDIVSWDPRGVGASIPRIECWASKAQSREWTLQRSIFEEGSPGTLFDALAKSDAASRYCEAHVNATTPNLLSHISTASHARDMLEISKQMGYEKIKYWGVSYGTLLGGTFAALYPERVERLVSDGNVDYHDWYDNVQLSYLQDADKIMEAFFKFCSQAGPEKCLFFERTPDAIKERLSAVQINLRKRPVHIPAGVNQTQWGVPRFFSFLHLQGVMRQAMYNPMEGFPTLARLLAILEKPNPGPILELFLKLIDEASAPSRLSICKTEETLPTDPEQVESSDHAYEAIMCADGALLPADSWTPDAMLNYSVELQHVSKYLSAGSISWRLACAGRQIRPHWTYPGPYQNITTAFPILFIGNTADPVTPLESAFKNSRAFPGSAVLVQKSHGHCSPAGPSKCTDSVIMDYFQNGKLPAANTVCEQDRLPFGDIPASMMDARGEMLDHELEREAFMRALVRLTNGGRL